MALLLSKTTLAQQLTVNEKTLSFPGTQVVLNPDGFPAMIQTSFKLITEPIHFHLPASANHKDIKLKNGELKFSAQKTDEAKWSVKNTSDSLIMQVNASFNTKGLLTYRVEVIALDDIDLDNIRLHLPITPEAAKSIKGLGLKEQSRPEAVDWKWANGHKGDDKVWIGSTGGGIQYWLTGRQPKTAPSGWSNSGKGGIHVEQKGKAILADNYSGEHHLKKGEALSYNFSMLITTADHVE